MQLHKRVQILIIMSLIQIYVRLLEEETNRLLDLSPHAFREYVCPLNGSDLLKLLEWVYNPSFKIKLLRATDSQLVYETLRLMSPLMESELLNIMDQRQRLFVVRNFSGYYQTQKLKSLRIWQELEESNWTDQILPVHVMTGELPAHYPSDMKTCVVCKRGYNIWDSVIRADCGAHSFCEDCDTTEGGCPVCT